MAKFNLLNYAADYSPPEKESLYVNNDWRRQAGSRGESHELSEYEKAGFWLCDHVNRNGVHELTAEQSFEVCHVLSRLKSFARNPTAPSNNKLIARLDRLTLMIGWRVWREATFGDAIAQICRDVEYKRRARDQWASITG